MLSDLVSKPSWCYDVDAGGLIQRWKQPSTSNISLLTNAVIKPEPIAHVSH